MEQLKHLIKHNIIYVILFKNIITFYIIHEISCNCSVVQTTLLFKKR